MGSRNLPPIMKPRRWLAVSCSALGFANLFGQAVQGVATTANSMTAISGAAVRETGASGAADPPRSSLRPDTPGPQGPAISSGSRITNLSTRARVAGDSSLITGFALSGATARTVLLRAIGPTLQAFGLTATLAAPRLKLRDAKGVVLVENTGWDNTVTSATAMAGAFPLPDGSADAVAVATLDPGTYTVEVTDDARRGGVVLTEIYDVNGTAPGSFLLNVSTRNLVAADGGELISGFTVSGTIPRQFLVRGVGPGLAQFNVDGVLTDPVLTIFASTGDRVATNDDWTGNAKPGVLAIGASSSAGSGFLPDTVDPEQVLAASQATGAFALDPNSRDAALVITLDPGAYTVQMKGVSVSVTTVSPNAGATAGAVSTGVAQASSNSSGSASLQPAAPGVALLEIYEVP